MSADTNANIEDVVTVVDNLDSDAPVAMEIEDKLTEVTTADPQQAHELVSDALDLGVLDEDETRQGFGGIRLVDADADVSNTDGVQNGTGSDSHTTGEDADVSDSDESTGEDAGFGDTNPGGSEEMNRCLPSGKRIYPETMRQREFWVTWILDEVGRKRPVAPWKNNHAYPTEWHGDLPEDEKPHTDFDTAKQWADFNLSHTDLELPPGAQSESLGIGILLPTDRPPMSERITLIDWDDVVNPDTGEVHPVAAKYIEKYGGYVELSTSGKGLHQFVIGGLQDRGKFIAPIDEEPFIGDDLPQVEMYDGGRHVAMTGRHVEGADTTVIESQQYINEIINEYGEAEKAAGYRASDPIDSDNSHSNSAGSVAEGSQDVGDHDSGEYADTISYDLSADEVRDALEHVPRPLSYHEWLSIGYAVHSWDPSTTGKDVFTWWSQQSPKWDAKADPQTINWIWQNANPERRQSHTTVGTLIAHAKQGGWEPPSRSLEPTTGIPLEMLASLDLDDARRFASKHDIEWATTREARERLRDEVFEVMQHGDTKVIDAPTALGKSYTVATEPWIRRESTTGGAPVIHTHETKKARDQAAQESADAGYEYAVLEGRTEACPVAAGEHDPLGREGTVDDFDREDLPETVITIDGTPASDFFDTACEDRGLPFSVAHKYLENHNDQDADLPCCAGEGECPAVTQWDGLPRTESGEPAVDVIHCTHQFAHVPSLRNGTNLIFDERPDFREDLTHRQVREAISAYLTVSGAPVTTFEEFVTRALNGDEKRNEHAQHATLRDAFGYEPDREWYLETEGAHTLAPALTRAVYYALKPDEDADDEHDAQDANGRYSATVPHEPPRLDANASDESGWNRTYVSVTLDANNTIRTVRNSPSLNGARSVIGLDAHPAQTQWELNVHPDIQTSAVLDPAERAMWRRFERGLLTVGVGDATRPFTSGEYFDREGSEAFFAALRDRFGEDFRTAITAASVESETKDILRDVGVEDPETMHYGEEKSRNDFAGEDVGALNGCIDPGDDFVLDLLAERGLDATPETTENEDGNEVRAHGRGFVGPDADAANELLASVRDQHIAQGAGRLARNADDPEDRAIVFVRTDAAPPGFLDMQVPGVEWLATDTQGDIIDELRQRSSATTRDIAESVGCSKEHARDTLRRLYDRGIVDVHENAGDHGAHLYRVLAGMDGPTNTNTRPGEHVDLSPSRGDDDDADGTANDTVCSNNTWALAISSVTPSGSVMSTGSTPDAPADLSQSSDAGAVDTGEPPG